MSCFVDGVVGVDWRDEFDKKNQIFDLPNMQSRCGGCSEEPFYPKFLDIG
ncbi:hypothetical protein CFBP498_38530 [Xanthomonas hortorum pv. vitians]|uniref:Uncharacterized protein n=1 Tax=Xanthomonas hortorum pv. vitians TaxID=83224 RepID=A0A6V7EQW5_9XANT|nr:hypothetical protein CFBP498_38530 [Xanthomonas hortorum pv. vitians]CAD0353683.1 hypothetical protein CFBP498_38530 [Xanthomonas hortorum pv. vitians]